MQKAAAVFVGFHDFRGFTAVDPDEVSTKVKIEVVDVVEAGDLILVRIRGSHFLWKMVRRLVGVIVEVGRGTADACRCPDTPREPGGPAGGADGPPSGLYLEQVIYEGEEFDRPLVPAVRSGDGTAAAASGSTPLVEGGRRGIHRRGWRRGAPEAAAGGTSPSGRSDQPLCSRPEAAGPTAKRRRRTSGRGPTPRAMRAAGAGTRGHRTRPRMARIAPMRIEGGRIPGKATDSARQVVEPTESRQPKGVATGNPRARATASLGRGAEAATANPPVKAAPIASRLPRAESTASRIRRSVTTMAARVRPVGASARAARARMPAAGVVVPLAAATAGRQRGRARTGSHRPKGAPTVNRPRGAESTASRIRRSATTMAARVRPAGGSARAARARMPAAGAAVPLAAATAGRQAGRAHTGSRPAGAESTAHRPPGVERTAGHRPRAEPNGSPTRRSATEAEAIGRPVPAEARAGPADRPRRPTVAEGRGVNHSCSLAFAAGTLAEAVVAAAPTDRCRGASLAARST